METAWIQVFVLTIAECMAPAGKTVCQEREFELMFLTETDCQVALEQLITLKEASANTIVDRARSGCAPTAREADAYASLEAINEANKDQIGWRVPGPDDDSSSTTRLAYAHCWGWPRWTESSTGLSSRWLSAWPTAWCWHWSLPGSP